MPHRLLDINPVDTAPASSWSIRPPTPDAGQERSRVLRQAREAPAPQDEVA